MTVHEAAAYLLCFDAPHLVPQEAPPKQDQECATESESDDLAPDVDPLQLRAELEAEFADVLRREREAFDVTLAEARERWTEEQARVLSERLSTSFDEGYARLRADVARILSPFVSKGIAARALEELLGSLRTAVADDQAPVVRISGPRDILDRLQLELSGGNVVVTTIESEEIDVRVEIGPTRIETRLTDWMRDFSTAKSGSE
ncbi:MAG: hypothetical protein CTY15_04215 [Methylocystis sp.]|nr:MAG: hypothetical protein CTY15_04215 [Methylocystis sp.]